MCKQARGLIDDSDGIFGAAYVIAQPVGKAHACLRYRQVIAVHAGICGKDPHLIRIYPNFGIGQGICLLTVIALDNPAGAAKVPLGQPYAGFSHRIVRVAQISVDKGSKRVCCRELRYAILVLVCLLTTEYRGHTVCVD